MNTPGTYQDTLDADHFQCAACGAIRIAPPAASDDYELDDGAWREAGSPICGPCARRGSEYPLYFRDGSDDEARRCCGGCNTKTEFCVCRVTEAEDGERGCAVHRCRA